MTRIAWLAVLAGVPGLVLANDPQQEAQEGKGQKQEAVQQFRAEAGLFTSPNYELEGRISSVSGNTITIDREELPDARLSLATNTKIEVDGSEARAQQLREGQKVQARFNLRDDMPVALEVTAQKREETRSAARTSAPSGGQPAAAPVLTPAQQDEERAQQQQASSEQQQASSEQQQASSGQQPAPSGGDGQMAQRSVVGTVESIGEDKLSLKNRLGETHEFALDDQTRFTRDGDSVSRSDIGEGEQVRAAFRGTEGDLQATHIMLMGSEETARSPQSQGSPDSQSQGSPQERGGQQQDEAQQQQ